MYNGVARKLIKLRTSKGEYCTKQWFSSITSLFKMGNITGCTLQNEINLKNSIWVRMTKRTESSIFLKNFSSNARNEYFTYILQICNNIFCICIDGEPKKKNCFCQIGNIFLELGKNILFGIGKGAELWPQNQVIESPAPAKFCSTNWRCSRTVLEHLELF